MLQKTFPTIRTILIAGLRLLNNRTNIIYRSVRRDLENVGKFASLQLCADERAGIIISFLCYISKFERES